MDPLLKIKKSTGVKASPVILVTAAPAEKEEYESVRKE